MRPQATGLQGLKLLVYEAFRLCHEIDSALSDGDVLIIFSIFLYNISIFPYSQAYIYISKECARWKDLTDSDVLIIQALENHCLVFRDHARVHLYSSIYTSM